MKKKINYYFIAIRCYLSGDDWESAKWYAGKIVYGWIKINPK